MLRITNMNIVISNPGTKVRKRDGRLILAKDDDVYQTYPLNHVNTLLCLTGVFVTEPVMTSITQKDGNILFMSNTGKLKYIIQPLRSILSVKVRLAQYEHFQQENKRLTYSKNIIHSKMQYAIRFLSEKYGQNASEKLIKLRMIRNKVKKAQSIKELRGIEGYGAKEYFKHFRKLLPDDIPFHQRQKRGKFDIVNSSLDFVYSLLYHTTFTSLTALGLDPYYGFYHDISYGHATLASDIMEPYRSQIADRIILRVMKDKIFQKYYFNRNQSAHLDKVIIAMLMKDYTKRIHSKLMVDGRSATLFDRILQDAKSLRETCLSPEKTFNPWVRI